jgi:hypothetical protein
MMSNNTVRAGIGVFSVLISAGVGVVTNLVTDKPTVGLGVCLVTLVACAGTAVVVSQRLERRASADPAVPDATGEGEPGPLRTGVPTGRQVAWDRGMAVNAGSHVNVGLTGPYVIVIVGILAVLVVVVALGLQWRRGDPAGATTPRTPQAFSDGPVARTPSTRPQVRKSGTRWVEFTLAVRPGYAYDLDVPGGRQPTNFGWSESESGDAARDLYLSGPGRDWQLYSPRAPKRGINGEGFWVMDSSTVPGDCKEPPGGDDRAHFFDSSTATVGDKACVLTGEGRPAMVELVELPKSPTDFITVRVGLFV